MTQRQYLVLIILAVLMAVAAISLGRWAENLNPDGIIPHTPVTQATEGDVATSIAATDPSIAISETTAAPSEPRSAFTFGASMGLLAVGLLYCVIAAGLLIRQRSKGLPANRFIVSVAALAVAGFAMSYLIDDYFY